MSRQPNTLLLSKECAANVSDVFTGKRWFLSIGLTQRVQSIEEMRRGIFPEEDVYYRAYLTYSKRIKKKAKLFKISLIKKTANIQFESHRTDLVRVNFRLIDMYETFVSSRNYNQMKQSCLLFSTSKWNCLWIRIYDLS